MIHYKIFRIFCVSRLWFMMSREIVIVDRQDITRLGMENIIKTVFPNWVLNVIGSKKELVSLLKKKTYTCIILDYTCSDFKSADDVLNISARFPETNWLLFSEELSVDLLKRLIYNDALFNIVLKSSALKDIIFALQKTYSGKQYICHQIEEQLSIAKRSVFHSTKANILTLTENEILKEIALGKTTKEIASQRNLSYHTVMTHRKNIFRKLEVNTIFEAIRYAIRAGIVDSSDYYI